MQEMGREFNLLEDDDDLVGLSTWWNERYIKDLSKKVKTRNECSAEKWKFDTGIFLWL